MQKYELRFTLSLYLCFNYSDFAMWNLTQIQTKKNSTISYCVELNLSTLANLNHKILCEVVSNKITQLTFVACFAISTTGISISN